LEDINGGTRSDVAVQHHSAIHCGDFRNRDRSQAGGRAVLRNGFPVLHTRSPVWLSVRRLRLWLLDRLRMRLARPVVFALRLSTLLSAVSSRLWFVLRSELWHYLPSAAVRIILRIVLRTVLPHRVRTVLRISLWPAVLWELWPGLW